MVARLLGSKGSFVRSEKGAFETRVSIACGYDFQATHIAIDQPNTIGVLDPTSTCAGAVIAPPGVVRNTWRFFLGARPSADELPFTDEEVLGWLFRGLASGAELVPIEWAPDALCGTFWKMGAAQTDGSFPGYEWFDHLVELTRTPLSATFEDIEILFTETNSTFPGFIDGETARVPFTGHSYGLRDTRITNVYECPGQFRPDTAYFKRVSNVGVRIPKINMLCPIPLVNEATQRYKYVTQVISITTPTGLVLDTSSVPVGASQPPCYTENPPGYWIAFADADFDNNYEWQCLIFYEPGAGIVDPNDWPDTGVYKFDLVLSP